MKCDTCMSNALEIEMTIYDYIEVGRCEKGLRDPLVAGVKVEDEWQDCKEYESSE